MLGHILTSLIVQMMVLWLEESNNLPVVTQLILGRAESWTQFSRPHSVWLHQLPNLTASFSHLFLVTLAWKPYYLGLLYYLLSYFIATCLFIWFPNNFSVSFLRQAFCLIDSWYLQWVPSPVFAENYHIYGIRLYFP